MLAFSGNGAIDQQQQQQQQNSSNVQQQNQIQGQMRLRDDPNSINPVTRNTRKRKSPSSTEQPPQQLPPPPQQILHHLPPPHAMIHPMQGGPLPPHYPYADYTPGGMPPNPPQPSQDPAQQSPDSAASGRALSSSKRAEQNRKAQRAFRERRDQLVPHTTFSFFSLMPLCRHVKALESRSQLLDAALASADEANRRWEECRTLVDQLRVENAALRAALSQASLLPPTLAAPTAAPPPSSTAQASNGAHDAPPKHPEGVAELKTDPAEASSGKQD
jgi:hypothetical protein